MNVATEDQVPLPVELQRLFERTELPASPALVAQILSATRNPNTTIEEFAELVGLDGVLSARLLKMANTALFAQRQAVTTIPRAVTVLGISRVRTEALGFHLVGHLDRLGGCPFDLRRYWQHALLRACLAREVATAVVSSRREEAFLVGLLQDCGVLLLVHLLGAPYAELYCSGGRSPAAFHEAEQQRFRCDHVQAITAMAEEWRLPEAIAVPLACHHQPTALGPQSSDVDRLCAVSYLAGSVGFQSGPAHLPSDRRLGPYAREQFGLSRSDLRACLRAVGKAYIEAAGLLGDTLPNDGDVTHLLNEAERQLTGTAGRDEDGTGPVAAERDDDDRPRGAPRSTVPDEHGGRAGVTPIADGVRAPPRHPKASHKHALRTGKGRSGRAARRAAVRALAKTLDDPDVRQHAATLVPEQFRAVALRLNRQGVERYANKRKSERKELLAPCALATFVGSSLDVTGENAYVRNIENAYVRNISTGGIGILATRPLRRGEPVEAAIISEGAAPLYVAGLVAFCRHIEGPVHEVGVRFMLHGRAPIFSRDPASAVRDHAWLAEALEGDRLGIDD